MPKVYITRRETFSAAHRLHNPAFSDAENVRVYGICNNLKGHGHNYELEVVIAGEVDRETGMIMNLVELKQIMLDEIIRHVDHKHLNEDVDFLRGINPTAENLVVVFWKILSNRIPRGLLHEVRLRETENNISIYRGE